MLNHLSHITRSHRFIMMTLRLVWLKHSSVKMVIHQLAWPGRASQVLKRMIYDVLNMANTVAAEHLYLDLQRMLRESGGRECSAIEQRPDA